MKKTFIFIIAALFVMICLTQKTSAQKQYKLRQVTNMMSMKMESTTYVKGMRKRTESPGVMGMGAQTYIEQCDLKRTVYLNDKKKLYFIEPFAKRDEQVIEDGKPIPSQPKTAAKQKGGVINMWYNIKDTGERKQMFGFTARHIWTTQKIKPSADACNMKDSMLMKTDGWYIDLPEFNCPSQYNGGAYTSQTYQPDCVDRYVTHTSGKGKLGFPLIQTTTIIMGGQANEITTSIETVEFSTATLDSMLFVIPPGYQKANSMEELQDKMDVNEMMKGIMKNNGNDNMDNDEPVSVTKKEGTIRIGVYAPTGNNDVEATLLQQKMVNNLTESNYQAVAINSPEDAKKYNCDYVLNTELSNVKQASKVGGILKAIKNSDPNAVTSYNIQANLTVKKLADNSIKTQQTVDGKYDGNINTAAGQALEYGAEKVLRAFRQL